MLPWMVALDFNEVSEYGGLCLFSRIAHLTLEVGCIDKKVLIWLDNNISVQGSHLP